MKINFKKIAPVIASAVMLGSTIGFAAGAADLTAYPSIFASKGVADVAVVYGESANVVDVIAGDDFVSDLSAIYGSAGTATTSISGGESTKIETSAAKLNIGENLTGVKTTALTYSDMPTLLAKKTFQSKDGVSYDYEQKITLGNALQYAYFSDTDYKSRAPTLGIKIPRTTKVWDYTLDFTKNVESDVDSNGKLEDIQDTDLTILGKSYRVLNAYNGSTGNVKLELMSGAVVDKIGEVGNKSYTISGKNYDVSVSYIASNGASLVVNGQTTPRISEGSTFKLNDGTQVGIRTLIYQQNKESSVEFSLGADKLTLENGSNIKINDVTNYDLTAYITKSVSSGKQTLGQIKITWAPDQAKFVSPTDALMMPALGSVGLSMGDITTPAKESIKLQNDGTKTMALTLPIKSGSATIDLITGNTTSFTQLGGEGSGKALQTNKTGFTFDRDTDYAFVATYISGTAAESYYLGVANIVKEDGINYTTIKDLVSNSDAGNCVRKKNEACTIGSVTLNIGVGDATEKTVVITAGTNTYFDRIVSAEGLTVYLPVNTSYVESSKGGVNLTKGSTTWMMEVVEEDKNSNNAAGINLTATVGFTSEKAEVKAVSKTNLSSGDVIQIPDTSTTYTGYVASDLGTKIIYDTVPTQDTYEIEYHGGETIGNVYVASSAASVSTSGGTAGKLGSISMTDKEAIAAALSKNLIVVGGPAVNEVAAKVLSLPFPTYGDGLTGDNKIVADQALIKLVASIDPTKNALVVFGWDAKDTRAAAKYLVNNQGSADLKGKSSVVLTVSQGAAVIKQ